MADPPWIVMDSHETWVTDERQDSSSIVTEGSTTDCWCGAQPPIHHAIAPTGAFGGPRAGGLVRIVANDEGLHLHSRDGDPLSDYTLAATHRIGSNTNSYTA
ncbi:hypothetical protein OIDMADRAFT_52419 [Oidiodendron maius Zn]|uniref:Uncharacterized protein n=1 Tax=Oidiodendron maius (strain Zn) TaxID=913774 RepID=A0A0C3HJS6_OIDMZ|nr:hypothetical protein OIDMADRAFT_52419 [Oidiodendron maius Zn]